jgi:hypothetical protein
MEIEVSLQKLTVVGMPFSTTRLLPCVAPKPEPLTHNWVPIGPVVAGTLVMVSGDDEDELTETTMSGVVHRSVLQTGCSSTGIPASSPFANAPAPSRGEAVSL